VLVIVGDRLLPSVDAPPDTAPLAPIIAEGLPDSATNFGGVVAEQNEHRRQLIDTFAARFGDRVPPVR
jgi:hypothetical protein